MVAQSEWREGRSLLQPLKRRPATTEHDDLAIEDTHGDGLGRHEFGVATRHFCTGASVERDRRSVPRQDPADSVPLWFEVPTGLGEWSRPRRRQHRLVAGQRHAAPRASRTSLLTRDPSRPFGPFFMM